MAWKVGELWGRLRFDGGATAIHAHMYGVESGWPYPLPLFGWHTSLFPTGRTGMQKIRVGDWRDDSSGPMQVVAAKVSHGGL